MDGEDHTARLYELIVKTAALNDCIAKFYNDFQGTEFEISLHTWTSNKEPPRFQIALGATVKEHDPR